MAINNYLKPMDWQEAYKRSQAQNSPVYNQMRSDLGYQNQQQQAMLRQRMGQKGQMGVNALRYNSGVLGAGLNRAMGEIGSNEASQTAGMANQIQQQDFANRVEGIRTALAQRAQQQQEKQFADQMGFDREKFVYGQGRDQVADQQWGKSFGLQEAGLTGKYNGADILEKILADRNYNLEKTNSDRDYNLALKQFNLSASRARSGGGGGGGGGGPKLDKNTVTNKVETYYKSWLPNNFAERGLDPTEYSKYLRYPDRAAKIIADIGASEYSKLVAWADKQEAAYAER